VDPKAMREIEKVLDKKMSTLRPKPAALTPLSIWHPSWSTAPSKTATLAAGASRWASAAVDTRSIWHLSWSTASSTVPATTATSTSKAPSTTSAAPAPTRSTANEPGRLGDQSRRMGWICSRITNDVIERLWSN
jgi:hypothetical protein